MSRYVLVYFMPMEVLLLAMAALSRCIRYDKKACVSNTIISEVASVCVWWTGGRGGVGAAATYIQRREREDMERQVRWVFWETLQRN